MFSEAFENIPKPGTPSYETEFNNFYSSKIVRSWTYFELSVHSVVCCPALPSEERVFYNFDEKDYNEDYGNEYNSDEYQDYDFDKPLFGSDDIRSPTVYYT